MRATDKDTSKNTAPPETIKNVAKKRRPLEVFLKISHVYFVIVNVDTVKTVNMILQKLILASL